MPNHNPEKKPVILPVIVTQGSDDTPVGGGIFIGEATEDVSDPSGETCVLEGMAYLDVPAGGEEFRQQAKSEHARTVTDDSKQKGNPSSYGYAPGYASGYDKIDWGKVTKN